MCPTYHHIKKASRPFLLPNEESNLAPQNQNLMYYRYTIRQRFVASPILIFWKAAAKVLLFFELTKYFSKKMQKSGVFYTIETLFFV